MKKLLLTIIIILLLILTSAFLVWNIHEGNAGMASLNGFALGTLFMSLLSLAIS